MRQLQNPWLIYPIRDLSGGTNLASNDFLHGVDELGLSVNWDLKNLGSVTKINGYSSYGTRIEDAINTLGIANFYYSGGQKQLLAVDFGSDIVSPSSSSSPSLSPSSSFSPSASYSPSSSLSPSLSPSSSVSPSASASPSSSVSPSESPSLSPSSSVSPSLSPSVSPSSSESPSNSPSLSPSSSESPSSSASPSSSPSTSPSASVSPSFAYNTAEIFVFDPSNDGWIDQNQELTSGSKVEFATFLDGLFVCNLADATRYYNGTTWSQTTNVTGAPKAKFIIPYGDRIALGYIDTSGTTHRSRVQLSSLPDANYNITWDTSATGPWFDVSPLDGDDISGLGKNFNRLLVFKENGLWRYDTNSLYQFPGAPGTNNNRSIQNVLEYTIYFHTSGVYGLRDNAVMLLSRAVQPIIDGVQSVNLDKICSHKSGDHYYLFLHDVVNEEKGINIPNCELDLDVARMRWTVRSLAHTPRVYGTYRNSRTEMEYDDSATEFDFANQSYDGYTSASDFIYFGDENGDVKQVGDSYDFDGTIINSYFDTTNYYIGGIENRVELQALKIYTVKGKRCKFLYSVDDGPWKPIVKYEYRAGEIYYTFESGMVINHIKLRCVDNSTGDRPQIKGFDFFYTPTYEI